MDLTEIKKIEKDLELSIETIVSIEQRLLSVIRNLVERIEELEHKNEVLIKENNSLKDE